MWVAAEGDGGMQKTTGIIALEWYNICTRSRERRRRKTVHHQQTSLLYSAKILNFISDDSFVEMCLRKIRFWSKYVRLVAPSQNNNASMIIYVWMWKRSKSITILQTYCEKCRYLDALNMKNLVLKLYFNYVYVQRN